MADHQEVLPETEVLEFSPSMLTAFENPLITDRILFHLSISDALELSLVSQFWRNTCRRYLRCRKHLEITLEFDKCCQLVELNAMLMNYSTDCLFVGSKLVLDMFSHNITLCKLSQDNDILLLYPYVFQKLPVKILRIDFQHSFDCVCENVLKKLLVLRAHSFTECLDIIHWPGIIRSFTKYLEISTDDSTLQRSSLFPSVRSFHFRKGSGYGIQFGFTQFLSEIIATFPALENIYFPMPSLVFPLENSDVNVLCCHVPRRKFNAIKNVVVSTKSALDVLLEIKPKLERFGFTSHLLYCARDEKEHERKLRREIKKNLATVIENCSNTLVALVSDNATDMLSRVINVTLTNCVVLELLINLSYPGFYKNLLFLKAVNYQVYFPNLLRLVLELDEQKIDTHCRRKTVTPPNCANFMCFSVKTLTINYKSGDMRESSLSWFGLAEIFPNVESLQLGKFGKSAEVVRQVWLPWNRNIEFFSCRFQDTYEKPCLILLTELLENLCDITLEKLFEDNTPDFNKWSYEPTRQQLFKCIGIPTIVLHLDHIWCIKIEHLQLEPGIYDDYKVKFDAISSWIRTKIPKFSLVLKFKSCKPYEGICNPIPFYTGRIDKKVCRGIFGSFQNWHLHF